MAVLVRYSRLLCARARAALLPVRYSCPLAFPTRLLLLLVSLLAPFVARYPFVAKYEHARYPYVAKYEHPPGTGTTRGANPGYPCVARARTRPCARARYCPYVLVRSCHLAIWRVRKSFDTCLRR